MTDRRKSRLTKPMRRALLGSYVSFGRRRLYCYDGNRQVTLIALLDRGLVEHTTDGLWFLTETGHAVWQELMTHGR